jgi:hypothetical protein
MSSKMVASVIMLTVLIYFTASIVVTADSAATTAIISFLSVFIATFIPKATANININHLAFEKEFGQQQEEGFCVIPDFDSDSNNREFQQLPDIEMDDEKNKSRGHEDEKELKSTLSFSSS